MVYPAVKSVTINNAPESLFVGDSGRLTATALLDNAKQSSAVTWSSSNTNVLTINSTTGSYKVVGEGSVRIAATAGGKTATCVISVERLNN
jgi:uncharacterized protein YjdB